MFLLSCSNDQRIAGAQENEFDTKILSILNEIKQIKPGMHRSDLNKFFTTEDGRSTRRNHVYVVEECKYIKVQFKFLAPKFNPDSVNEEDTDEIESVGTPYLDFLHN